MRYSCSAIKIFNGLTNKLHNPGNYIVENLDYTIQFLHFYSDKIPRLNRFSCALIINGVDKKLSI